MEKIYSLSNDTWDDEEICAINKVIKSNRFSMGENVYTFEKKFADVFESKYAIMSNSGSSANLLMFAALVYSGRLKIGDEVLVPAVSWSTTYFPVTQFGLKLRFVDIDIHTLNIDLNVIEKAITSKTKAILSVNLLGNPNDFTVLKKLCNDYSLILLEDNCESMGAIYNQKMTGTFGLVGTFSTFYSHHMCTMEGGITVTDDDVLYHYMLAIRAHGWTRNLPQNSLIYKKKNDEFYESFNFIVPGFNLRPLEIEAAIGLKQLDKLPLLIKQRRKNACYFKSKIEHNINYITQKEIGNSSWFGFSLILVEELRGKRDFIINKLVNAGIEVRPIVAGNFTRQQVLKFLDYSVYDKLSNADYLHDNGFFVGNHSIEMKMEIDLLLEILDHI